MRQIFPSGSDGLLKYDIAPEVTAFSPLRDAVLPMRVVQAHQVHGDRVAVVTSAGTTREELEGYDALVTNVPGVAVGARTADCIPVLLYDPVRRVVAAVHSGWKGTVLKIAAKVLAVMASKYGTRAADILAVIGPGIGPDSFQVGPEVAEAFLAAGFPETWSRPSLPIKHSTDGSEKTGTATCSHSSTTQPHTGEYASFTQHSSGLVHNSPLEITVSTESSPIDNHTIRLIADRGPRIPGSMSGGLHMASTPTPTPASSQPAAKAPPAAAPSIPSCSIPEFPAVQPTRPDRTDRQPASGKTYKHPRPNLRTIYRKH